LGSLNPNNGSAFNSGRREINWDGVPDNFSDPTAFPGNFFNSTTVAGRARGALFSTEPGASFLVSADSSNPTSTAPVYGFPSDFIPFSAQRLFTPINSLITDITFFVPGTTRQATIGGFGAVLLDVEIANLSKIEFFDAAGVSLFSRTVLTAGNGGLSFLGAAADAGERIARVRISAGDAKLLGNNNYGPGSDGVVLDDFIYAEPVPEPGILGLLGIGWLSLRKRVRQAL
jgi:hypothetical protein